MIWGHGVLLFLSIHSMEEPEAVFHIGPPISTYIVKLFVVQYCLKKLRYRAILILEYPDDPTYLYSIGTIFDEWIFKFPCAKFQR